jgi:ubiquinone/menaquinone biosynthesis C-methylase UbiE
VNTQTRNDIRNAYDRSADEYARLFFRELDYKHLDRKLYDLFAERTNGNGPVLEIGCGPGEVSAYLYGRGLSDLTGMDFCPGMIRNAVKLCPGVSFEEADVMAIPRKDGSIAGVVAPYLIVNFSDDEIRRAVKEIARVLMPEGWFLMSFHCGSENIHVDDFLVKDNPLDFPLFDPDKIEKTVNDSGLKTVEKIVRSPYPDESETTRCYLFTRKTAG